MNNISKAVLIIDCILIILQLIYISTTQADMFFIVTMLISWIIIAYTVYSIWSRQ